MSRFRLLPFAFLLWATAAGGALAQGYPVKPVRIIVGFAPGGSADIIARLVAQKLNEAWKSPVIVDNRAGAGSTIAAEMAAKAQPDGYTLTLVSASHATSAGLYLKLNYDPVASYAPVAMVASGPNVLVAHPGLAARSVKELIALVKAAPGKYTMGSAGTGSITHLSGELLSSMADIRPVHVPYKGGGPGLVAVVAGEVNYAVLALPTAMGQARAGRVRALGVTSRKRSPALPDVPTVAEAGVPGYEAVNWWAMLAPARTPVPIVSFLNREITGVARLPDVVALLADQGAEPEGGGPDALGAYLRSEVAKWSKVIARAKVPRE